MPFAFRHQPLKFMYMLGALPALLFIRLPIWSIANALPSWRPVRSWSLGRTLIVNIFKTYIGIMFDTTLPLSQPIEKAAATPGFVWIDPAPQLVVGEISELAQVNHVEAVRTGGFWHGPKGASGEVGQRADKGEKVIYHFHGGAYVMGSGDPSDGSMTPLFDGLLEHLPIGTRLFVLEYRLSSAEPFKVSNPFPAALIDAIAGYRYLVEDVGFEPQNIILSGDSAGGGLAFDLAYYIGQNELPILRNVRGLLLLSPTVDWAATHVGPKSSMEAHSRSDFVHAIFRSGYPKRALMGSLPMSTAATSMWISPGSLELEVTPGQFAHLPRTCIVAGGVEMTLDPMITLRDRIRADMGEEAVRYIEEPEATHDFITQKWHEPERTNALREIAKWVGGLWALDTHDSV